MATGTVVARLAAWQLTVFAALALRGVPARPGPHVRFWMFWLGLDYILNR